MIENLSPSAKLTYQWAARYISLGWFLLPIVPQQKYPYIEWKERRNQKPNLDEVRNWLTQWPQMNLGLATGALSQVVVIDLDGLEGLTFGKQSKLTSSVACISGKGKHLYYKWEIETHGSVSKIANKVDVRADGDILILPPSLHKNGKRYRWERFVPTMLGKLPKSIIQTGVTVSATIAKPEGKPNGWIAKDLEGMKEGNIDDTLFKVCARLRHDGYSEADALVLLTPHALRAGATDGHLTDKIRNVWGRYEASPKRESTANVGGLVLHSPTNPDSINEYGKRTSDNQEQFIGTGYVGFDTLTKGLRKGEVLAVCARTGVGKTNWLITPMRTFCEAGKKVLIFSTEMSFDQIWSRYRPTLIHTDRFEGHQLFVCDEFTPDINRIEEAIKNVLPDLFIFDHISHIGTDYHIISKFMSEIKRLSRLYDVPAIVTAQLNRNADYVEAGQRIEPRLSMIQGSDQIGQMSAQVLLLNEKRIVNGETEIEGIVVKNRHGDKGMIQFILKREPYRMCEAV